MFYHYSLTLFSYFAVHATTLSHISLLLSPPTMSGASEPFGTGSNRADSKGATSNSTVSINSLSMTESTGASGNGSGGANRQTDMFSKSILIQTQQARRLVDQSILHNILGSGVRLLSHREKPYIHTITLYNAHCCDLHHHCYLIFDLRAIPCVAACYAFLQSRSILTVQPTQATLIILRILICRGSKGFTSAEGGLKRNCSRRSQISALRMTISTERGPVKDLVQSPSQVELGPKSEL
jgi:hypothetical protein